MVLATAALVVSGCGGDSSGTSASEVTVETGSLTKAEFAQRADAICSAVRSQFGREYTAQVRNAGKLATQGDQEAFLEETIQKLVLPNYEKGVVDRIATLGAPAGYAPQVSEFLEALQQRLAEIDEEPKKLINTAFPFSKASKAAEAAGLEGCANSFS